MGQEAFEREMGAAWLARDFAAWDALRPFYGDWCEENGHPLWGMCRAALACNPLKVGRNKKPWLWVLRFQMSTPDRPRPRWWGSSRVNAGPMLGLPPGAMRCKGWEGAEGDTPARIRFTVAFNPRSLTCQRWKGRRDFGYVSKGEYVTEAAPNDRQVHEWGFAALFLPPGWAPALCHRGLPRGPQQGLLFDDAAG